MKHQVLNHPKTARLAEELGIDRAYAVGIVGALWCFASEYAIDGDLSQHTPQQLATNIGYQGDSVRMVCALCAHKWLDQTEDGRTLIHDWPEHCSDFIHMRLVRMNKRFADGSLAKTTRLNTEARENYNPPEVCAQKAHSVRMVCALSNPIQPTSNPTQSNLSPPSAPAASPPVSAPEIPKSALIQSWQSTWNTNCGSLPKIEAWADGRKKKALARLNSKTCQQLGYSVPDDYVGMVQWLASSSYHCGDNDRGWVADFDFMISSDDRIQKTHNQMKAKPHKSNPKGISADEAKKREEEYGW